MTWTQPICDDDFRARFNKRPDSAARLIEEYRDEERCCICGKKIFNGLYVRINPITVPYPRREE